MKHPLPWTKQVLTINSIPQNDYRIFDANGIFLGIVDGKFAEAIIEMSAEHSTPSDHPILANLNLRVSKLENKVSSLDEFVNDHVFVCKDDN